jgi:hypothetical protein
MQLHVHAANHDNVVTNIWMTNVPESWTDAQVLEVVQAAAAEGNPIAQRAIATIRCWTDQSETLSSSRVYLDAA